MTAPTPLTTVTRSQGNNRDLKQGQVIPEGFALRFEEVPVLVQAFRRMVRGLEFDVCEMAFTTYLCAKAHGRPFTALPIFLMRGFHHGAILRAADRNEVEPKHLEGKRVGVNRGYTVTTGVWARSILQDEHGVDLDRVTWVLSGDEHVQEYRPPENVEPAPPGSDLAELLRDGDLAACVGLKSDRPELAPLIDDPGAAAIAAFRERGFYPINHLVVVRDDLLAEHPELARSLFEAFAESKRRYVQRLRESALTDMDDSDRMHQQVMAITGQDPLPYGIEPNREMIEELLRHAVTQHILDAPLPIDRLFAPGTNALTG